MGIVIGLVVLLLILGFVVSVAAVAIAAIIYVTVVGACTVAAYLLLILITGDMGWGLLGGIAGFVGSILVMGQLGVAKPKSTTEPTAGVK